MPTTVEFPIIMSTYVSNSPESSKRSLRSVVEQSRASMAPKFVLGARVSILAKTFDTPGQPRWSEDIFGDVWPTARVFGKLTEAPDRGLWIVTWDDGDETQHTTQQLRLEPEASETSDVDDNDSNSSEGSDETQDSSDNEDLEMGDITWVNQPSGIVSNKRHESEEAGHIMGMAINAKTSPLDIFLHFLPMTLLDLVTQSTATPKRKTKRGTKNGRN